MTPSPTSSPTAAPRRLYKIARARPAHRRRRRRLHRLARRQVSRPLRLLRRSRARPQPAGDARRHPQGDRPPEERGRHRRGARHVQDPPAVPTCCAASTTTRASPPASPIYQTRFGDWRQLFRELDEDDKVTKADIRRVANKIFVDGNRTSATHPDHAAACRGRHRRCQ